MSQKFKRAFMAGVVMVGMLSMFAAPAAAQDLGGDGPVVEGDVTADDAPSLDVLLSILGGEVLELDCSFSQDGLTNPNEVCSLTAAGQALPPEDGGGSPLPTDGIPLDLLGGGDIPILGDLLDILSIST